MRRPLIPVLFLGACLVGSILARPLPVRWAELADEVACETDGVHIAFTSQFVAPTGYRVISVEVSDISSTCSGQAISVSLHDDDATSIGASGRRTIQGEVAVLAIDPAPLANAVTDVHVEIGGERVAEPTPELTPTPTPTIEPPPIGGGGGGGLPATPTPEASTTPTPSTTPDVDPTPSPDVSPPADPITAGPCAGFLPGTVQMVASETGNVWMILGTTGDDTLVGTAEVDTLCALGGSDDITAGGGDDRLAGGPGDDVLRGGRGDDVLKGGSGDDDLLGGNGADTSWGRRGADVLLGGRGRDRLMGGGGRDVLYGGPSRDVLRGGRGNDVLHGGTGADIINGGAGFDVCYVVGNDKVHNCERVVRSGDAQ